MSNPFWYRRTCHLELFPTLRGYSPQLFRADLSAGLVLTAMLIPVGMSYAEAAGLPAICGLYATIVPLLAYACFGHSRLLVLGPDSALAGMIASAILPLAAHQPEYAVMLASMLALMVGGLCITAGYLRLGFLTELLSKPIRYGYLHGIALTILVSQTPKLLGLEWSAPSMLTTLPEIAPQLMWQSLASPAALTGLTALGVMLLLTYLRPQSPVIVIGLVVGTTLAWLMGWSQTNQLDVVGTLPHGLPRWTLPHIPLNQWIELCWSALAIALVAFADMSVLSRTYAQRLGEVSHTNRELVALGWSNVLTGLFQGFPITSSGSRTPVAEAAGARTQMTGIVAALTIILCLWFGASVFALIPKTVLAAIVIIAGLSLMDWRGFIQLYRLRPSEFGLAVSCMLGVLLFGVVQGIFLALAIASAAFMWRAWRPYDAVLGRIHGVKGYHDVARHPEAVQIEGLILFRWDAPLFFANQDSFRRHLWRLIEQAQTPTRWMVIAAEPITDIDLTAAEMLHTLKTSLQARQIELRFAELKGPVKDRLKDYGLYALWGDQGFYPTIGRAVDDYVSTHQIDWIDWEDTPRKT
jgi:high affinity sulfate transporter 1